MNFNSEKVMLPCRKLLKCCRRLKLKNPFHNTMVVTFITCLCAAYTSVYPFTYLPEMIRWFGYHEVDKGYYAGFIASSYFIGNAIFSYFWGWLSDKKGRKPVLIFQLMCIGCFCLLFGFCRTFAAAVTIRFFDGSSNGILTVGNAILFDSTDDSNHAFALSVAATAWGLGVCMGPLVSGYLASPATKYPWSFDPEGVTGTYPYCIPSFIGFVIALVNAIIVFIFLPGDSRTDEYQLVSSKSDDDSALLSNTDKEKLMQDDYSITDRSSLESNHFKSSRDDEGNYGVSLRHSRSKSADVEREYLVDDKMSKNGNVIMKCMSSTARNSTICRLMQFRGVTLSLIVYGLFTFSTIGFWEILPVWLSTDTAYGGLGFSSGKIGLVLGTVTIAGLIIQSVIVTRFERRYGCIIAFIVFALYLSLSMHLVPLCRLLQSSWSLWTCVFACSISVATSMPACYAAISIIINNSSPANQVGQVNGLAQTLGSFIKSLGPITGGNLFTLSITSNIGPPLDPSTVFVFFGVVVWVSTIVVYFLPRHLDRQSKYIIEESELHWKCDQVNDNPHKSDSNYGYGDRSVGDKSVITYRNDTVEVELNHGEVNKGMLS